MLREEFNKKLQEIGYIGEFPSFDDYKTIEYVYTYHPSISETDGKYEIAMIYKLGGMTLIEDMRPRAVLYQQADDEVTRLRLMLLEATEKRDELRSGKIAAY